MDNWLSEYAQHLSQLNSNNLSAFRHCLADRVEFRDPFNHTFSQDDFIRILEDMYIKLDHVSFNVHGQVQEGNEGVLFWTFSASSKITGSFEIEGNSRVSCDKDGKVMLHHDYWDASELMQQLPLLGMVIGKVRKKMSHS